MATPLNTLPRRQIVITLAGIMLALFLASLDQTIVGTAMPRIIADLGGFAHYTWLTTAYLVTSTVVQPVVGRLTDIYGRKGLFILGITIFTLGSLASGLAQSMTALIIFRAVQGLGGGIMMTNAFTAVADLFPPAERGKYVGLISGVFGVSAIIGPVAGGFITDAFSWHWIFFVNIPIGLALIYLFARFFPKQALDKVRHPIDYAGITALTLAVVPLLIALSLGGTDLAWNSPAVIGMIAVSVMAIIALVLIESHSKEPLIPLAVFQSPIVAVALFITFITGFGMFAGITFIPLYFQGVLGVSATTSGSFLTPMMLGQVTGSFLSGQALSRAGGHYKLQGFFGLAVMAVGLFLLSRMTPGSSYGTAIFNIVLVGFGLGITMPIYTIAVQNAVPYNVLGSATSSVPFFRSVGGSLGLAIFGSVLSARFASQFTATLPDTIRNVLPADTINNITHESQVLVSPQAQAQLQAFFQQLGSQGQALYQQFLEVLRGALNSALVEIFLIGCFLTIFAFGVNFFIKEVPLRKQHMPERPEKSGVPSEKPGMPPDNPEGHP